MSSKKGTSLVEILVVMVVLLIGIMTIVQMFPTGFRIVRSAESQTIATRLAQQELERWKNMSANLPTGILAIDEDGNPLNNIDPYPPFFGWTKDSTGKYVRGNGLNARYILGETTEIPVASYFDAGNGTMFGSKYNLAFSPIDMKVISGKDAVVVKSGDMKRIEGDFNAYPPVLRQGQYAIDYTITDVDGKPSTSTTATNYFHIAFPTSNGTADRTYYITYSYWSDDGKTYTQPDQPIKNVPGNHRGWLSIPINTIGSHVVSDSNIVINSDLCARGFVEHTGNWSPDDPYEFKIADPIGGVIAFNPAGNGVFEYTANGVQPLKARIDYRIYDMRIIREDKIIPDLEYGTPTSTNHSPNIPMKLSLKFILDLDDPTDNPNEETYQGLVVSDSTYPVNMPLPLYVIDLATGLRVDVPCNKYDKKRPEDGGIDFKQGIVYLPITADLLQFDKTVVVAKKPLAGRHLRFFYRADGDWSLQCQKAYANYTRASDVASVDYRRFAIGSGNMLLFAPCDAGKTVSVDYTYVDANKVEHKVTADSFQISDTTDTATGKCYIDLDRNFPDTGVTLGRVNVAGTSFKARVLWRDGKTWRHVDMDTSLIRDAD